MIYFTHQELASAYHVSVKTVRNWIDAAKQGKLDLVLHEQRGRVYISNTASNIAVIEGLVQKGKKYRPHHTVKVVSPRPEFYAMYTQPQIYDIVNNLDIYSEVPRQYGYFDGGAHYWDEYVWRLAAEKTPNILNRTIKLLDVNHSYLDDLLSSYKQVNVIDVGTGNALPVKELISHLLEQGKMGRYIALDISPEMLLISEKNIKSWFGGKVKFEPYCLDISAERFTNVLAEDALKQDARETVNLVLLLGGTSNNLREPDSAFRAIHDSMGRHDLFLQVRKLDTAGARKYFDFNAQPGIVELPIMNRFFLDLLSIDPSCYEAEAGFDADQHGRYIRVRLKLALTIHFTFDEGERRIELNKDDTILLWRAWHTDDRDVLQQLDRCHFHTLHASQTNDWQYLLTVAQIKHAN